MDWFQSPLGSPRERLNARFKEEDEAPELPNEAE